MPDTSATKELIERVTAATGPDREIDCLLHAVVVEGRTVRINEQNQMLVRSSRPPHDEYLIGTIDPGVSRRNFSEAYHRPPIPAHTFSIDDARALVERKLPGWMHASGNCGEENMPWACLTAPEDPCPDHTANHVSEPLAIILALLRALQGSMEE